MPEVYYICYDHTLVVSDFFCCLFVLLLFKLKVLPSEITLILCGPYVLPPLGLHELALMGLLVCVRVRQP